MPEDMNEGGYSPDSGFVDDLNKAPEGSMEIPASILKAKGYKPGDRFKVTVKGEWPREVTEEDGTIAPKIISIEAEEMQDGPRMERQRESAARGEPLGMR